MGIENEKEFIRDHMLVPEVKDVTKNERVQESNRL